jgi:hypothetical protein
MPAILHLSSSFAAQKIALVSQSVAEQNTGLVNVSVEYVTTREYAPFLEDKFRIDSPPPIWPSSVQRANLLQKSLFFVTRSVRQENGFVYISAQYAGALARPTFYFFIDRESPVTTFVPVDIFFKVVPLVHVYRYTQIGNDPTSASYYPTKPSPLQMYSLVDPDTPFVNPIAYGLRRRPIIESRTEDIITPFVRAIEVRYSLDIIGFE